MISRRNAMKGGLVMVSTAAAYGVVKSPVRITEAAAQPQGQYSLFLKGSSEFYGVSVAIYAPDVVLQYEDQATESVVSSSAEAMVARLLSHSRLRGERFPDETDDEVQRELDKSLVILGHAIYNDQTTGDLLKQAKNLSWVRENPWFLLGVLPRGYMLVIVPLAGIVLDELVRGVVRDGYAEAKAWFLEFFEDEEGC